MTAALAEKPDKQERIRIYRMKEYSDLYQMEYFIHRAPGVKIDTDMAEEMREFLFQDRHKNRFELIDTDPQSFFNEHGSVKPKDKK